jgi:type II secretory pathway component PulK
MRLWRGQDSGRARDEERPSRIPLPPAPRGARAFVLIAVLVVILLASMVAVSLLFHVKAEDAASIASTGSEQAWNAAMSGVYEAMRVTAQAKPGTLDWRDNPSAFRERLVFEDGVDRWYFTIYAAPDPDARDDRRFGLTDEASKLNLNTALETNLLKLPRMTLPLAQSFLDFTDADSTARPEGAEQDFYDRLPSPYTIRNGPLDTIEELLLVRGFTPALYYGEDANQNFRLDPNEDDGDQRLPLDDKDGKLDLGLRQFLTVSSYEYDDDDEGVPRTALLDAGDALPKAQLPEPLVTYILALRTNKITVAHAADLLEAKGKFKDESGKAVELASGVGRDELPLLLDLFTANKEYRLTGLININTAPAPVLTTVPGIDESLAESIVSARRGLAADRRRSIAWLYQEGVVDAATFKKLAPHLTARSFQFTFQVVGYSVPSSRFRVLEAMIDLAEGKPVITYLRDLTRLGRPFRWSESVEESAQARRPASAVPSRLSKDPRPHPERPSPSAPGVAVLPVGRQESNSEAPLPPGLVHWGTEPEAARV